MLVRVRKMKRESRVKVPCDQTDDDAPGEVLRQKLGHLEVAFLGEGLA